jgi:hypothetical protein
VNKLKRGYDVKRKIMQGAIIFSGLDEVIKAAAFFAIIKTGFV